MRPTTVATIASFAASLACAVAAISFTPSGATAQGTGTIRGKPINTEVEPTVAKPAEVSRKIDKVLSAAWDSKGLMPALPADDLEWFRRITIDLVGRAPRLIETEAFLASDAKTRRAETLDSLLKSREHAAHFGELWGKALIQNGGAQFTLGRRQFVNFLIESVASNKPWDQVAREILTATENVPIRDPSAASPTGYWLAFNNQTPNIAGNISRGFLGVQIQCVQCHDDMIGEPWSQSDFRAFASAISRTRTGRVVNDRNSADYNIYQITDQRYRPAARAAVNRAAARAANNPALEERLAIAATAPRALAEDDVLEGSNGLELRTELANWITAADNPWFARATVNRIWGHMMKRGIIDPIDDFSSLNQPSVDGLLEMLAEDFVASGFDLRRLIRIITSTTAYQLSSRISPTASNSGEDRLLYSRHFLRQLTAEELFDSLVAVSGLDRITQRAGDRREVSVIREVLLRNFRSVTDDDEMKEKETFTGTIPQALLMMNSNLLAGASSVNPGGTLSDIVRTRSTPAERVKAMYLAVLTREPTASELTNMTQYITDENGTTAAYEDLMWALLNSAEFLNHH